MGRPYSFTAGLLAAGLLAVAPATAQDGGLNASVTLNQSLIWSDNPDFVANPDAGFRSRTSLGFNLSSVTSRSSLSLGLGATLEPDSGLDTQVQSGLVDPRLSLRYSTESRNTRLSGRVTFRETAVNDLEVDPDFEDDEVILGTGSRRDGALNVSLETGRESPLGLTLSASERRRIYVDTVDPNLFDTRNSAYSADVRMRMNPALTLTFGATVSRYEADDADETRRDSQSARLGLIAQIDGATEMQAGLSYTDNRTERLSGDTDTEGLGANLSLTRRVPDGSYTASLATTVASTGRQTTLRVTRAMNLPGEGGLSFSLGAVQTSNDSVRPLASLSYNRPIPRGAINVALTQAVRVDSEERDVINTRLRASYSQSINAVSGWSASVGLASTSVIGVNDDVQRMDLGLNYRHALTEDWDLNLGYTRSASIEDIGPDREANTISFGLSRSFRFRP